MPGNLYCGITGNYRILTGQGTIPLTMACRPAADRRGTGVRVGEKSAFTTTEVSRTQDEKLCISHSSPDLQEELIDVFFCFRLPEFFHKL